MIIGWKTTGEGYMKTTVNQSPHFEVKSAQLWSRQAESRLFWRAVGQTENRSIERIT
jgi:hypothetical protein